MLFSDSVRVQRVAVVFRQVLKKHCVDFKEYRVDESLKKLIIIQKNGIVLDGFRPPLSLCSWKFCDRVKIWYNKFLPKNICLEVFRYPKFSCIMLVFVEYETSTIQKLQKSFVIIVVHYHLSENQINARATLYQKDESNFNI